jgi:alanine-synthesizing transaminase
VAIAREHQLVIFADEVYDKVLYDDVVHTPIASLSQDVLTLTFNSLSKSYRSCGYRAGWMVISGDKKNAADYIEGLNMLSNMRLCSNVPGQWAIQTARLDPAIYPVVDDRQLFLELLEETRVMLVQGTGFNWATPDHFRIVFLPHEDDLREAIGRVARFLESWRRRHAGRASAVN